MCGYARLSRESRCSAGSLAGVALGRCAGEDGVWPGPFFTTFCSIFMEARPAFDPIPSSLSRFARPAEGGAGLTSSRSGSLLKKVRRRSQINDLKEKNRGRRPPGFLHRAAPKISSRQANALV